MDFKQWLEVSEDDFFQHHYTGHIPSHAYERYEEEGGLSWLGDKSKHPKILATKQYGPHKIEFRQNDKKSMYVHPDNDQWGPGADVRYMTDDEMAKESLPTHDTTIYAYVGDKPIALASNEFGTAGVWVEKPYQKLGLGSDLLIMFMELDKRFMRGKSKIGQMTNAGQNMTRAAYRKLIQKYGPDFDKQ